MSGENDEFVSPEDMIDHNGDFNNIENLMTIFVAYNQKNIADGTVWDNWPDWELCLTEMMQELHFEHENDSEEVRQERKDWLALMQFIHDSDVITLDGFTITVLGKYGSQFRFELCLEYEVCVLPGEMEAKLQKLKDAKGKRRLFRAFHQRTIKPDPSQQIEHSLGELWTCPEHVSEYGGKGTSFTDDTLIIDRDDNENFAKATLSLIQKCIDDTQVWITAFEKDMQAIERAEWLEENWPGGIPDQDWEYQ
jgi:hypothetical protein